MSLTFKVLSNHSRILWSFQEPLELLFHAAVYSLSLLEAAQPGWEAELNWDSDLGNAQVAPGSWQRCQPPGADGYQGPGAATFTRAWSCFLLCSLIEIFNCSIFPTELCSVIPFGSCAAVALSLCVEHCLIPADSLFFFPSRQRIHRQSGSTKTCWNRQTSDWRADKFPRLSIAGAS